MATISHTQTLWASDISELGQASSIAISGGGLNPNLIISDPISARVLTTSLDTSIVTYSSFSNQHIDSVQGYAQTGFNGELRSLNRATIMRVCENAGAISKSESTYFQGSGFYGDLTNVVAVNQNGIDYVFVTDRVNGGIVTLRADIQGDLVELSSIMDTGARNLANLSSLASVSIGGNQYIVAASLTENALNVLKVGADGALTFVSDVGPDNFLAVDRPTDISIVKTGETTFVLMTSFGSKSVSVFKMGIDGTIEFVSQISDSLDTRFGGASSVDSVEVNGQIFVVSAGNDGGVTVFQLLPNGQLMIVETISDSVDMALQNIEQAEFVKVQNHVEIWVLAKGDAGLTRLEIDFGNIGITATGQDGSSGNDVLSFTGTGGQINGFAGDDILIEGAGDDTMIGGNGADLFVFSNKTGTETIQDFNFQEDTIDFSTIQGLNALDDLNISVTSTRIVLTYHEKTWVIKFGAASAPTFAQLSASTVFGSGRVFLNEGTIIQIHDISGNNQADDLWGTAQDDRIRGLGGDDTFHWSEGRDIFDGASGNDTVSYLNANQSVTVNLASGANSSGAALGDQFISIEHIEGSQFADRITGDQNSNRLLGAQGNDRLYGQDGDDFLTGGAGHDVLDGGLGTDMADYGQAGSAIYADLQVSGVNTGADAQGDTYISIENLRGGAESDDLRGDEGANMIIGGLGYDFIMGRDGSDILIGSHGNDILVGGNDNDVLNGGPGNDRLLGQQGDDRMVGEAGNDKLIDFFGNNSMIGGAGNDLLYDGAGNSILYGGTGDDRLIGSVGHDRLYGASGDDILNGGNGNDFIAGDQGRDYLVGGNGWDSFIFRKDMERDTIADFTVGQDRLMMTVELTHGITNPSQIISQYASISSGKVVFDFGAGDQIILANFTNTSSLAESILIIA